jgi:NAD dependent epimerase/dehydratase family enzyme
LITAAGENLKKKDWKKFVFEKIISTRITDTDRFTDLPPPYQALLFISD